MFIEFSCEYAWIIPACPLVSSALTGLISFFFPKATNGIRRLCAALSISLLAVSMVISISLFWQQSFSHSIKQYLWPWILRNDIPLKIGFLVDPLTLIMSILVTTVGILVMIYSDSYMSHDQGYVRFFTYLSLFAASMLGLVFSPNLVQIYAFWELVGMCSYLLIGFWFSRPNAANACQKAFVTNRMGDFGLLLGILGIYWITGSFEIRELCQRFVELMDTRSVDPILANIVALLLFLGPIAKSAQFPLHVWLPDAMEGPTPISALIHAATMVAAGIFLIARIFDLIQLLPLSMNVISWIGGITALLGSTLALAQRDLKKGLAYSTMSQLGYMVLALGIGAYRSALFHLITHAYSKASLFPGSGSVIHSMEKVVGYSPTKSQDIFSMGGLRKYMPITGTTFLLGTLSLCGIPPLACFWSKDEIIAESWLFSSSLGWITSITAGFTAFYMFRIYFLTFEGFFRGGTIIKKDQVSESYQTEFFLWGESFKNPDSVINKKDSSRNFFEEAGSLTLLGRVVDINNETSPFRDLPFPKESSFAMLLPLILLAIPTLFAGSIGIQYLTKETSLDFLSQWLIPLIIPDPRPETLTEFLLKSIGSLSFSFIGFLISYGIYGPNSSLANNLFSFFIKRNFINNVFLDSFKQIVRGWSLNRGYIDKFYDTYFISNIIFVSKSITFFDRWLIDGLINGTGVFSLFGGEGIRYGGGGRVSYYLFGLTVAVMLLLVLIVVVFTTT